MSNNRNRASWTREDHSKAAREKRFLFVIAVNGQHVGEAAIEYSGVCDRVDFERIVEFIKSKLNREKTE